MDYPKVKYDWHKEKVAIIEAYSNRELLENTIDLASGDDWDGNMTPHGQWEFEYLKAELYNRLKEWLDA